MGPIGCPDTSVNNYNIRCVTTQKSEGLSYILKYRVIMVIFLRNFKTNFYDILEDIRMSQNVSGCWHIKAGQYYFARWDLQFFFPFKNVNKWRVICGPVNWVLSGIGYNCLHTPSRLRVSAHFVITEFNRHTTSCLYNYIRLSIITRRLYFPPCARVPPPPRNTFRNRENLKCQPCIVKMMLRGGPVVEGSRLWITIWFACKLYRGAEPGNSERSDCPDLKSS